MYLLLRDKRYKNRITGYTVESRISLCENSSNKYLPLAGFSKSDIFLVL